jgi:hypothetical protein
VSEAFDEYSACIKAYTDLQSRDSSAHVTAANNAIEEYNKVAKKFQEAADARRDAH